MLRDLWVIYINRQVYNSASFVCWYDGQDDTIPIWSVHIKHTSVILGVCDPERELQASLKMPSSCLKAEVLLHTPVETISASALL